KTPLEKLFEGDKLFVAPSQPNLGNPFQNVVWFASLLVRQVVPGIGSADVTVPPASGFSDTAVDLHMQVLERGNAAGDVPSARWWGHRLAWKIRNAFHRDAVRGLPHRVVAAGIQYRFVLWRWAAAALSGAGVGVWFSSGILGGGF